MRETIVSRRLQSIIAAAMAVVVCAIVGSVAVVQWQHRQSEILGAGENVQNLARVIEGQVRGNMDAIDITLNGLARALPRLPGTQRPGDADIHTLLSDSLKHLPFARALWVLNADGDMVHDTDRLPGHFNLAARVYFAAQRDNPALGLYLGPPLVNPKGVWFLSASRRINHADGSFAGVVVAAIEPRYFERFFESINVGKTGVVALHTPDNMLIARTPAAPALIGKMVGSAPRIRMALAHPESESLRMVSPVDGVARILAYRQVPDRPLVVVVGLGEDEVLAPWRASSWAMGSAALGLNMLIAALAYLVWNTLNRSSALHQRLHAAQLKAEGAVQELTALVDAIPDLIFEMDLDGRILSYRTQRHDLLAMPPDVFVGKLVSEVLPAEPAASCLAALREAHAQGSSAGRQYKLMIGPDLKWFEASVARKSANSGQDPRFVFLSRDITARREAEAGLRESESRLAGIVDSAMDAIISVDSEQRVVLFNAAAQKMFGYSAAIMLGQPLDRLMPEQFRAQHRRHIEAYGATTVSNRSMGALGKIRAVRADGQNFPVEASISQIEIDGQKLYTVILRDITEREQAEQALRASEITQTLAAQTQTAILNALPAHIAMLDWQGVIVAVNESWRHFATANSGQSNDFLVGENYLAVCDAASGECSDESHQVALGLREVLAGNRSSFTLEYPCHSPHEQRWYRLMATPLASGVKAGIVVMHVDVTKKKAADLAINAINGELERSNADLEQFAYAASHDLIEPLRSVTSSVQLLQKRYQGQLDARADEFIAHAVSGAARMLHLITDLLALSRLTKEPRTHTVTSMETALANACENLETALAESGAQITQDPLPQLNADSSQMTQLLQNLLSNGIKFRGKKPALLHVGAQRKGDDWVFSVADQGIGIEPQYFSRIFELFKRLHTRTEYAGTGVGLALCQKIVRRHGGRIWVESEVDEGTTFFFTLPASSYKNDSNLGNQHAG